MTARVAYPPGVPCWVETLQRDPRDATAFYADVFGWDVVGPGPMPGGGEYFVARTGGLDVAGIGSLPPGVAAPAAWTTHVSVDDVDAAVSRARAAGGRVVAEPFDALPAGCCAVLATPCGAIFGVWEARAREGAQLVNAPNAWAMSSLRTRDVDGAIAFYEKLFGWQAQPFAMGPSEVTLSRLPGYIGGLEAQPVPRDVVACIMHGDAASAWHVDFWTDDADAAAERAERAGGRIVVPPFDAPPFRQTVLADRAGATFSVSQLKGRAA